MFTLYCLFLHTDIENKKQNISVKIECITFILYQLSQNKQPSCDLLRLTGRMFLWLTEC